MDMFFVCVRFVVLIYLLSKKQIRLFCEQTNPSLKGSKVLKNTCLYLFILYLLELFFAIAIIGSYTKEVEPMPYTYPLEFKIKAIRRYEKVSPFNLCAKSYILLKAHCTTGESSFAPSRLRRDHTRLKNLMLFHVSFKSWNLGK